MTTDAPLPVRAHLDAVIAGMKHADLWDVSRPADEAFVEMGAFGMRTMAFVQWLRWVFVPRVEETLLDGGPWPDSSAVAVQATRELDTCPADVGPLLTALHRFDALFR